MRALVEKAILRVVYNSPVYDATNKSTVFNEHQSQNKKVGTFSENLCKLKPRIS